MIGLSAYLEYAKAQNKELLTVEGIVIYDNSVTALPMFMIFIPAKIEKNVKIEKCMEETLLKPDSRGYIIYFQSIKWILPNLEDIVRTLDYKLIKYGDSSKSCKISYGRFTFDKSIKGDPENITLNNVITQVPIFLGDRKLVLLVSELAEDIGTPKLFEAINNN